MAIYLAMYKGHSSNWRERLEDGLIRLFTRGRYSHCEIAIERVELTDRYTREVFYDCYSASPRYGGVRCMLMSGFDPQKWDLIKISSLAYVKKEKIERYFQHTKGRKYDLLGALGLILGFKHKRERFFCSEWCYNAIFGSNQGWQFNPNQLAYLMHELTSQKP